MNYIYQIKIGKIIDFKGKYNKIPEKEVKELIKELLFFIEFLLQKIK